MTRIDETFDRRLMAIVGEDAVLQNESMTRHTTFRTGGPALRYVSPGGRGEIRAVMALARECAVPYLVIGNGSNLLVSDSGFDGVVIEIGHRMSQVTQDKTTLTAEAGETLTDLARRAMEGGLAGLEFASGIPGTLGGAVCMNAGAYGGEMKDVVRSADLLMADGEMIRLNNEDLKFGYRKSIVTESGAVVLAAHLELEHGRPDEIRARMEDLRNRRREKQPLDYPSAGSTFKRPEGYFAGKLITEAGLSGMSVGGAQVSEKHCGFIINRGGATSADILRLIRLVQARVYEHAGVRLETEVKLIGDFGEADSQNTGKYGAGK